MSLLGRMFGLNRDALYDQGLRLFDQGLYAEAILDLDRALRADPDELTERLAKFYIGEAHAKQGEIALGAYRYAEARESLGRAVEINPHYPDLRFQAGQAARGAGEHAEALLCFEAALGLNPCYARAHFCRGLTLYALDRPGEAYAAIGEAVALDAAFETGYSVAAHLAHTGGDYATAQALFARIAETDVDDITFHTRLGADLYGRGMFIEAAAEFTLALALNPRYADLHNHLGITLHAQGLYPEAIREFETALAINPRYAAARTNLGLTLKAGGRHEEAAQLADVRGQGTVA